MEAKTVTVQTKVVELTKEQFNDLTADFMPTGVKQIHTIAVDILGTAKDTDPEILERMERCRRFLNTQNMIRQLMQAFKEP